jgi:hypothetical protein
MDGSSAGWGGIVSRPEDGSADRPQVIRYVIGNGSVWLPKGDFVYIRCKGFGLSINGDAPPAH